MSKPHEYDLLSVLWRREDEEEHLLPVTNKGGKWKMSENAASCFHKQFPVEASKIIIFICVVEIL
jgi:hypothetical protein